jgi:hypothetical protein
MKKVMTVAASLLSLVTLSGPSMASFPCANASAGEPKLICYCHAGGTNCRCTKVADDQTGMEVW